MTEPAADLPRCCGKVPASIKDGPIRTVCMLCSDSPNWWRAEPGAAARLAGCAEHYARTGSWLP